MKPSERSYDTTKVHVLPHFVFQAHPKTDWLERFNMHIGVYDSKPYDRSFMTMTVIGPAFESYHPEELGLNMPQLYKLLEDAYKLGAEFSKTGIIANTGCPPGVAAMFTKGMKENGGRVLGISPWISQASHEKKWHSAWINKEVLKDMDPFSHQEVMLYSGLGFNLRNVVNEQISTAYLNGKRLGLTLMAGSGGKGTLAEAVTGIEETHTILVYSKFNGATNLIHSIAQLGTPYEHIIFDTDIAALVERGLQHHKERIKSLEEKIKGLTPNSNNFLQVLDQVEPVILAK